ncbi:collagenase-like [Sabethes cyaneus]|uniref:collagenase-like n=1 Tax=Sabethes cyaneus TaxID=53552 RepID=UPI00237E8DE8|nr:collagenase-like [Sabethes cyaneus]
MDRQQQQLVRLGLVLAVLVGAVQGLFAPNARIISLPIEENVPIVEPRYVASGRISGGELVQGEDVPYAAGILIQGQTGVRWCGGSLITSTYVLSAANCFAVTPNPISVLLGASDMTNVTEIVPAETLIIHIGYEPQTSQNDIALLQLARAATFGPTVQPVRLPNWRQLQSTFVGQLASVSGWGALWHNAPEILPMNDLRRARLPVITNLACGLRFPGAISESQLCVDADMGSPCSGDQGGPMTVTDPDGNSTLIGVFSYVSILGCNSGWPAVFTRVTPHLQWIQSNSNAVILDDFEF